MKCPWKFSIDINNDEYNHDHIRSLVINEINDLEDGLMIGNDIYIMKLADAFLFRMRMGDLVSTAL